MAAFTIPGVVLSSLIFRLKNGQGDAVGFLLGETFAHSVSAITDTECSGTREEKKTCIQQHIQVEGRHRFSNNNGEVDFDKLSELLNNQTERIVGWFTYCCNCSPRPSLFQKAIHSSLMKGLQHIPQKDLLFGLFNESNSERDVGINTVEYSFYQYIGSQLKLVHIDVVNLQSTSVVPYQRLPMVPIPSSVTPYSDIMAYANEHLFLESGELKQSIEIEQLCRMLIQRLEPLKNELITSYESILKADEEIRELREQISQQALTNEQLTKDSLFTESSTSLPPLVKLGDKLAGINGSVPNIDLLSGSPPPSNHVPLIPATTDPLRLDNEVEEMEC